MGIREIRLSGSVAAKIASRRLDYEMQILFGIIPTVVKLDFML